MNQMGPKSFSLASLFTLLTVIAVILCGVRYAPTAMFVVTIAALPAVWRMKTWRQLAAPVGRTFTVTEWTLDYLGAIVVGGIALASIGQTMLLTVNPYLLIREHDPTVTNNVWFFAHLAALGACEYFLIGELWLLPGRFVETFGRLPTRAECAAAMLKAVSLGLFVLGGATWALLPFIAILPPNDDAPLWLRYLLAVAVVFSELAVAAAAYRWAPRSLNDAFPRGCAAGILACVIYFATPEAHPAGLTWLAEFVPLPAVWLLFVLGIWQPFVRYPPRLRSSRPSASPRSAPLPQVITVPDFPRSP